MSATNKTERLIDQVSDALNRQFPNSCVKSYDASHDVYLTMTVGGLLQAIIKYTTVAQGANGVDPVTGAVSTVFVPDVVKVGFDNGEVAEQTFVVAGPTGGVPSSNFITGVGANVEGVDSIVVNGVTFLPKDAPAGAKQFESRTTAGSDADAMASFVAVFNAYSLGGTDLLVADIIAVQDTGAPTKVWFFARSIGPSRAAVTDLYTLAEGGGNYVVDGATFGASGAGVDPDAIAIDGYSFWPYSIVGAVYTPALISLYATDIPAGHAFLLGSSNTITRANLVNAINAATDPLIFHVVFARNGVAGAGTIVAYVPGVAGNSIPLVDAGGKYTLGGATLAGGVAATTDPVSFVQVIAACTLLGTEVRIYTKSGIVETDLATETYFITSFRDLQWGYINQQ